MLGRGRECLCTVATVSVSVREGWRGDVAKPSDEAGLGAAAASAAALLPE